MEIYLNLSLISHSKNGPQSLPKISAYAAQSPPTNVNRFDWGNFQQKKNLKYLIESEQNAFSVIDLRMFS